MKKTTKQIKNKIFCLLDKFQFDEVIRNLTISIQKSFVLSRFCEGGYKHLWVIIKIYPSIKSNNTIMEPQVNM